MKNPPIWENVFCWNCFSNHYSQASLQGMVAQIARVSLEMSRQMAVISGLGAAVQLQRLGNWLRDWVAYKNWGWLKLILQNLGCSKIEFSRMRLNPKNPRLDPPSWVGWMNLYESRGSSKLHRITIFEGSRFLGVVETFNSAVWFMYMWKLEIVILPFCLLFLELWVYLMNVVCSNMCADVLFYSYVSLSDCHNRILCQPNLPLWPQKMGNFLLHPISLQKSHTCKGQSSIPSFFSNLMFCEVESGT